MDADSGPPPMTINSEPVISDLIDLTIKTIDSKNFQFQVESDVRHWSFLYDKGVFNLALHFIDSNKSFQRKDSN